MRHIIMSHLFFEARMQTFYPIQNKKHQFTYAILRSFIN